MTNQSPLEDSLSEKTEDEILAELTPPKRGRGRPRKYGASRRVRSPKKLMAQRDVIDLSDVTLEGLGIEDLFEETKMRGISIPTFVHPESGRGLFRIDSLIQIEPTSPLHSKNVFNPECRGEARESLNAAERLRVALYEGSPRMRPARGPKTDEQFVECYDADYQLYATRFELQTAEGTRHHGLVLWQAPTSSLSEARLNMPGWRKLNMITKTRLTAMKGGFINNVLAKLDKKSVAPEVVRWYPLLQSRPLNPRTRPEARSRIAETWAEEEFMLQVLAKLQPLPNLLVGERHYDLNLEKLMRDEDARYSEEMEDVRQRRLLVQSIVDKKAQEEGQKVYDEFFRGGANASYAQIKREQAEERYRVNNEVKIPDPRKVRASLVQQTLRDNDWDLVDSQGAVALLISDPISELMSEKSTAPEAVLGTRERTWKKMNKRVFPDGTTGAGRSVPNLRPMTRSGAVLTIKSDAVFIQHELAPTERRPLLDAWPTFLPDKGDLRPQESMRISEIPPPLAVRWIDPYMEYGELSSQELIDFNQGKLSSEEREYLIGSRTKERRRVAVLLAPGQALAHCLKFWDRDEEASRIFRLHNGCHLLIFGPGEELRWPTNPPQSMQQILSILTGREIVTFDSSKYKGPRVPYNETLQLENTEEPEYLIEPN